MTLQEAFMIDALRHAELVYPSVVHYLREKKKEKGNIHITDIANYLPLTSDIFWLFGWVIKAIDCEK